MLAVIWLEMTVWLICTCNALVSVQLRFDTRSTVLSKVIKVSDVTASRNHGDLFIYYAPAPNRRGHKAVMLSDVSLTFDVCQSVAYIGHKTRTGNSRKTKIGTVGWHRASPRHTWLGHHFQGQRSRSPGRFIHRSVNASGSCSGGRGNVLAVGNYCYGAVGSAAPGALAPTEGGEGLDISWRPPAYSLLGTSYYVIS